MAETNFDPDAYALGLGRPIEYVPIFEKPALTGRLNQLRRQADAIREQEPEQSLANPEVTALEDEYERVYKELADSKRDYQVQGFSSDEVEKLAQEARKACKEKADEAAATARGWGKEQAQREGVTDPHEVNELVRRHAREAASAVINQEIGFHTLAAALVEPRMDVDEVRALPEKIGQLQFNKLMEAFYTATADDPGSLPKSLRRGKPEVERSL